ncbi:hypothetical protein V493_07857 [Pseudogymnoascus sp. VKM F-4281 (FW-2241)]|nr:hypothetical protein V493_07857 [Pseudogymnoascus sp. VKM F-4281 (FW-2241)]
MRFISALVAGALAVVAAAQSGNQANPFTNDNFNGIEAGESFTVTWDPTTDGTVTLQLVQGDPGSLNTVSTIEAGITNSGSYTWTPDSSTVKGSNYALKIVDDDAPEENYNYTLQFAIDSDVTESSAASSTVASTSSTEASTSTEESTTSTTEEPSTTSAETTASETTASESTITDSSSTEASTTATSTPTTTKAAPETTSSEGAAATGGAKVGAGLVGFVGAAMLLL